MLGADLRSENLRDSDLAGVNLSLADLRNACLTGADRKYATLLETKVTDEQHRSCKTLEGATMPDGSVHD